MTQLDPWPFTPAKLSSLIEPETLSVLLSGCSARLGRAMTVLDYDQQQQQYARVDTKAQGQNYADFCAVLRDDELVQHGNAACEHCDLQLAREAINTWCHDGALVKRNHCHMQLVDFSHVIRVYDQPVGVLLTGQFGDPARRQQMSRAVQAIGEGRRARLHFVTDDVSDLLLAEIDYLSTPPEHFAASIAQEVQLIERIAVERHRQQKLAREQRFLDELRAKRNFDAITSLQELRNATTTLLDAIRSFCHAAYVIFYINVRSNDTVLTPVAQSGFVDPPELPHFNWRKANLPNGSTGDTAQDRRLLLATMPNLKQGLRGEHANLVADASCAVTTAMGNLYRAVMIFGPFQATADPAHEEEFLLQVNRMAGWFTHALLQTLHMQGEQERREALATLLQHRIRTALTPIVTHIGNAKQDLATLPPNTPYWRAMSDATHAAHELALQLGKTARETLHSTDIMVERSDLRFDIYPLSVLVANCAEGFVEQADQNDRRLTIDNSIENLPSAEVDIARLTIAISNLLDNAVKYSYPSTTIQLRARSLIEHVANLEYIEIVVESIGNPIPQEKMQQIFERGKRALVDAKMGKIPGTGYGLWETRAVIEAHGGAITPACTTANFRHRAGIPYRVTFTLRIPLSQSES